MALLLGQSIIHQLISFFLELPTIEWTGNIFFSFLKGKFGRNIHSKEEHACTHLLLSLRSGGRTSRWPQSRWLPGAATSFRAPHWTSSYSLHLFLLYHHFQTCPFPSFRTDFWILIHWILFSKIYLPFIPRMRCTEIMNWGPCFGLIQCQGDCRFT